MRKLLHPEIVSRQKDKAREPRLPLTVVLNNIRSLYNVGAIFRTADGVGAEGIMLCGITGAPPQSAIAKTALGAEERLPWEYHPDAACVLRGLKARGSQIVLLEQIDGALQYQDYRPRPPVCLVVGNEIEGVEEGLLPLCDLAIEIPMAGSKNSLNVAVAFGIAAFLIRERLDRQRLNQEKKPAAAIFPSRVV